MANASGIADIRRLLNTTIALWDGPSPEEQTYFTGESRHAEANRIRKIAGGGS